MITNTFRTHAAFFVGLLPGQAHFGSNATPSWKWLTWDNPEGNKHAAIILKAREIGASGYDCGNADHDEIR